MKRILGYMAAIGLFFATAMPQVIAIPEISTLFPHFAEIYAVIEGIALKLVPDEIEQLLATISEKIN